MEYIDPVILALRVIQTLLELRKRAEEKVEGEEDRKEKKSGPTRRFQELPQLVAQAGLTQALSFYLAKSFADKEGQEAYKYVYQKLRGTGPVQSEDNDVTVKALKFAFGYEEKAGYPTALAATIYALQVYLGNDKDLSTPRAIAEFLEEVRGGKESEVTPLILDFLLETKLLSEALLR